MVGDSAFEMKYGPSNRRINVPVIPLSESQKFIILIGTVRVPSVQPWKECGLSCGRWQRERTEKYILFYCSEWKHLPSLPLLRQVVYYILISFSICQVLLNRKKFTKGRFSPRHRAQAVRRRLLNAEALVRSQASADIDLLCRNNKKGQIFNS
jgi:hypothetical protein